MLGSALVAFILLGQVNPAVGRYDMNERLKELDRAWTSTSDKSRRLEAIADISAAASAFQKEDSAEACRSMDEAIATLQGRSATSEDAVTLRFDPPFVEPKMPARLRVGWAYMPTNPRTVRLQVGRQSLVATPGRSLTLDVRPEQINPDILQNPEVGYLLPVQVGYEQRNVFLSIIKKPKERLGSLRMTKQPEAQTLVDFLSRAFNNPDGLEADIPLIQYLFAAELLDEGRLRPERADSLPLVRHQNTYFRAMFPRQARGPLTLVIGLHGPGGSENLYFEAYGNGRAVTESLKRNWAFVAPRASGTAVEDVIDWIQTRRRQRVDRLFVMGHGLGGGVALQTGRIQPKPRAIAVFAPDVSTLPSDMTGIPVYASIGRQDTIFPSSKKLMQDLTTRKGSISAEFDPCEHWMVVADSIPAAFKFFDSNAGR